MSNYYMEIMQINKKKNKNESTFIDTFPVFFFFFYKYTVKIKHVQCHMNIS